MELRPPLHLGVVAIEKGAFGSPSTMVANFTYLLYIYIYMCVCVCVCVFVCVWVCVYRCVYMCIHIWTLNKFSLFSNRWPSQNCIRVVSYRNASIMKYCKQAWNSVNVISLKNKQLFFHSVKNVGFHAEEVYLRRILLFYFIQMKSTAEVHRILVEFYGNYTLSETICSDWPRRFKNNDYNIEDKEHSDAPKKFQDEELEALLPKDSCLRFHYDNAKKKKKWVNSWLASNYMTFFRRRIQMLLERWENVVVSDWQYFQL